MMLIWGCFFYFFVVTASSDVNSTCYSSCADFEEQSVGCGLHTAADFELYKVGDLNCHCDVKCLIFEDCCSDYEQVCEQLLQSSFNKTDVLSQVVLSVETDAQWQDRLSCRGTSDADSFYFVDSCPTGGDNLEWSYPGLSKVTPAECNSPTSKRFGHSTPVTHVQTGITYNNIYCAVCNGASLRETTFWDTTFYCKKTVENVDLPKTVTRKVVSRVLESLNALYNAGCATKYSITASQASLRKCHGDGLVDEECNPEPSFTLNGNAVASDSNSNTDTIYSVEFRPKEKLILRMFGKRRTYEMDVCEMLPHPDLCWTITKTPTCVQQLSTESFAAFDFDVRESAEGCAISSKGTRQTLMITYVIGRCLSCIILLVLICIKRTSISDKKASNFEKNAVTFLMFLWMKSVFHLLQYTLDCRSVAMFVHFLQDSAFMWVFVMGYDLHLERRDLMPPFLYMMTSWVFPLIIAIIGAIMSLGRVGLYWLYTETNVCWYAPLYWEIPEMIIPFACNFYTLALTVSKLKNGLDSTPHHIKFLVLFPLLFLDYLLPMFAAYLESEIYLSVTLILQAYWGIIMAVAYFIITFNDHRLDAL